MKVRAAASVQGNGQSWREKGLAAVQTVEDIDRLAVVSLWAQQHERDAPQEPIIQVTAEKKAGQQAERRNAKQFVESR